MTTSTDQAAALAWLATASAETQATFVHAPHDTIVPSLLSTNGARAMAVLEQLAGRSPGASRGTAIDFGEGEILGEGGMGIVRSAHQPSVGRMIAVKSLKKKDPAAALDLLREAWVTGAVEHPNVVPVHFVDLDAEGLPIVAMKRIEGAPWHQLCGDAAEVERRFGATDLLAWNLGVLMAVLNAIRYAHHRGVIHRDLKPANVMIGDFGEVYLVDWGIAIALRDDGSGRLPLATEQRQLAGTPAYMAPEMLAREGSPPLSERTDVYLAGAVLFELIAGRVPHAGNDIITVIASIVSSEPELPASAPPELARICQRAMHADPAQRYASAEELRLALQSYLEHRGSSELVERASARLRELIDLLAAAAPDRDEVYRVLGACRFGFHAALAAWRDNDEARAGILRATTAVAEMELAAGRPASALTLLADVDAPELTARAQAASAARDAEVAELERMRAEQDVTIGRRTRSGIVAGMGTAFTSLPLAQRAGLLHVTPMLVVWISVATFAIAVLLGVWARHTLLATRFNRRLFATLVSVYGMQIPLAMGALWMGLSVPQIETVLLAVYAMICALLGIYVDRWLAVSAPVYVAAFLVSARWPDAVTYAMSAGNLVFAVTAFASWRPETFHKSRAEREVHARLKARRSGPARA